MQHTIRHGTGHQAGNATAPMSTHDDQVTPLFSGKLGDHLGRLSDMNMGRVGTTCCVELLLRLKQGGLAFLQVISMQGLLANMGLDAANRNWRVDMQQVDFRQDAKPGTM